MQQSVDEMIQIEWKLRIMLKFPKVLISLILDFATLKSLYLEFYKTPNSLRIMKGFTLHVTQHVIYAKDIHNLSDNDDVQLSKNDFWDFVNGCQNNQSEPFFKFLAQHHNLPFETMKKVMQCALQFWLSIPKSLI